MRKVGATQGAILPNGKGLLLDIESAAESKPPSLRLGKGETVR